MTLYHGGYSRQGTSSHIDLNVIMIYGFILLQIFALSYASILQNIFDEFCNKPLMSLRFLKNILCILFR